METTMVNEQLMANAITHVLYFLTKEIGIAVDQLFPLSHPGYKGKWRTRDPFSFWMQLDAKNRVRLIELARIHYLEG